MDPSARHRVMAIGGTDLARGLRASVGSALFTAVLMLIFVTLSPLPDRSDAGLLGTLEGGAIANQIVFPLIAAALLAYLWATKRWVLHALYHPILWVVAAWLALTILTSQDPLLSARRMMFNAIVIVIAALMAALPRTRDDFADGLAIAAGAVLIGCYGGVMLWPDHAIHLATDALEADLAGDWRGLFPHKNQAGAVMVLLIFFGLFYARVRSFPIGWIIVTAATVFLYFTKSKTSIAMAPFILAMSLILPHLRSLTAKAMLVFGLLAIFNLATIGSSVPGPVRSVVRLVLPDATFTGRTDLWAFAIDNIEAKPVFGHGYGAFWRTEATAHRDRIAVEPQEQDGWAAELGTDAHNGYLETALSIGIPGLVIVLIWVMIVPLADYQRIQRTPVNEDLVALFLRIWLLGLYLASLESILLDRTGQNWFMLLVSIFAMRLLINAKIAIPAPGRSPSLGELEGKH